VTVALGSEVGPGTKVADLTAPAPSVQVKVPLEDQTMAALGASVTIGVPDGSSIAGTVAALGLPEAASSAQQPDAEPKRVVPVEISLADTGSIGALQEATVSVGFIGEKHENVLTVPVDALLAQPGGGFAVEVVGVGSTRSTVPVTVGLYQNAMVEVAGDGLAEGTTVVTAP
jgi:hypothetical protein